MGCRGVDFEKLEHALEEAGARQVATLQAACGKSVYSLP